MPLKLQSEIVLTNKKLYDRKQWTSFLKPLCQDQIQQGRPKNIKNTASTSTAVRFDTNMTLHLYTTPTHTPHTRTDKTILSQIIDNFTKNDLFHQDYLTGTAIVQLHDI